MSVKKNDKTRGLIKNHLEAIRTLLNESDLKERKDVYYYQIKDRISEIINNEENWWKLQ